MTKTSELWCTPTANNIGSKPIPAHLEIQKIPICFTIGQSKSRTLNVSYRWERSKSSKWILFLNRNKEEALCVFLECDIL